MIKYIFSILFFLITAQNVFSYENQGFTQFDSHENQINFSCEKQCFILLGNRNKEDILQLTGEIKGNGIIGYGILDQNQIIPGSLVEIKNISTVKQSLHFKDLPYYSQLPEDIITALVFEGSLQSSLITIENRKPTFSDILKRTWDNFIKIEPLTPYTINLRYGVKIGDTSIVTIAYILFILLSAYFLFQKKSFQVNYFLTIGLILFLIIGIRNLITNFHITKNGLQNYTFQSEKNKIFFDSGDYYTFIEKSREILKLDEKRGKKCLIYFESFRDWPFIGRLESVYGKPCYLTSEKEKADYFIFYKKEIPQNFDGDLLLEYNSSYLLKK